MFAFSSFEVPTSIGGGFAKPSVNRKGQTGFVVYDRDLIAVGFFRTMAAAERALSKGRA
jgi:hypothetical protein